MTELKKQELSISERFTGAMIKEFETTAIQGVELSPFHQRLFQNYFIKLDLILKEAEVKRLNNTKKKNDPELIWSNINMNDLAQKIAPSVRIGLDPSQPNHVNMIPYLNNRTKKYDIGFILGYRGIELKAVKYGLSVPDDVIVEVKYTTDKFRPIKKDINNKIEAYEFEITQPFDRGEIEGGFYYHVFYDKPEKNILVMFNLAEIEKRKARYASAEFWGGDKDVYKNGQKTGEKEKVEGWFHEMVYKTIYRAAYNCITIDSRKIDDDFVKVSHESKMVEAPEEKKKLNENSQKLNFDITENQEPEKKENKRGVPKPETIPQEPQQKSDEKTEDNPNKPNW